MIRQWHMCRAGRPRCTGIVFVTTLLATGCMSPDRPRVSGRTVYFPNDAEYRLLLEFRTEARLDEQVIADAMKIVETGHPYMVTEVMGLVSHRAVLDGRGALLDALIEAYLKEEDAMVRWAAIEALYYSDQHERAAELLRREYPTLLIRPDRPAWWAVPWWRSLAARTPVMLLTDSAPSVVACCRGTLVGMLGEYRLSEGVPVLEAIVADPWEWHSYTKDAAKEALEELRRREDEREEPGARP